jgi:hypothetical protein
MSAFIYPSLFPRHAHARAVLTSFNTPAAVTGADTNTVAAKQTTAELNSPAGVLPEAAGRSRHTLHLRVPACADACQALARS